MEAICRRQDADRAALRYAWASGAAGARNMRRILRDRIGSSARFSVELDIIDQTGRGAKPGRGSRTQPATRSQAKGRGVVHIPGPNRCPSVRLRRVKNDSSFYGNKRSAKPADQRRRLRRLSGAFFRPVRRAVWFHVVPLFSRWKIRPPVIGSASTRRSSTASPRV